MGLMVGMSLACGLVIGVEFLSSIVHPLPAHFDGNMGEHVRRYPHWVLGAVVLAWGATGWIATWVGARLGNRTAGIAVALLLECALVANLLIVPYTIWFRIVMLCVFPAACLMGCQPAARPSIGARTPSADR